MKNLFTLTVVFLIAVILIVDVSLFVKYKSGKYEEPKPQGLNPVVRLTREGKTYCSGVVIDPTTIVTAGHCIAIETPFGIAINEDEIEIRAFDNKDRGTTAKFKPGTLHVQLDRAILKGDFRLYAPAPYISDVTENVSKRVKGAKFISCGYPMGLILFCTETIYVKPHLFMMKVRGTLIPGMSGGPTFTSDGRVIAINDAVDEDLSVITPIYGVDQEK